MTKGLGKYHLSMIETRKKKLVEFISKHQPVTYAEILKNGHVRRKNLGIRLDELEKEKRVMKTNAESYIIFNKMHLSTFNYLNKLCVRIEYLKQIINRLIEGLEMMSQSQPVRFSLAMKKINLNELGIHKHEFIIDSKIPYLKRCRCNSVIMIDGKIHYRTPRNEIERIEFLQQKTEFQLSEDIDKIKEFYTHFRMYPRMEYQGLKNISDNTRGIHSNFLNGKELNYEKIEKGYEDIKFFRTWPCKCSKCGTVTEVDVADEMNLMIIKAKKGEEVEVIA